MGRSRQGTWRLQCMYNTWETQGQERKFREWEIFWLQCHCETVLRPACSSEDALQSPFWAEWPGFTLIPVLPQPRSSQDCGLSLSSNANWGCSAGGACGRCSLPQQVLLSGTSAQHTPCGAFADVPMVLQIA